MVTLSAVEVVAPLADGAIVFGGIAQASAAPNVAVVTTSDIATATTRPAECFITTAERSKCLPPTGLGPASATRRSCSARADICCLLDSTPPDGRRSQVASRA